MHYFHVYFGQQSEFGVSADSSNNYRCINHTEPLEIQLKYWEYFGEGRREGEESKGKNKILYPFMLANRVPPIYEKFSDQVPNWAKVVPWQMGQNEPLIN